jgi:hypothetical protein
MGGAGGGGYFSSNPRKALRELLAAQRQTENQEYEAESNNALQTHLAYINNRDVDAINRRLDVIKQALQEELDGTIDLRFGGSVAKHTYVDGLSDVDSLVLLDKCELASASPSEAKGYLARRLREELVGATISEGRLAVTVQFPDVEIQLLPAVSCKGTVQIADSKGDEWADIKPREFARVLSRANEQVGGKVVPVIKLAKAIIANLPENQQISGYHAESLAVKIFDGYQGSQAYKDMLKYFFEEGASQVGSPIRDRTGQSVHVDTYLGRENSLQRRIIADAFARIGRRMSNADATGSTDQWLALFET